MSAISSSSVVGIPLDVVKSFQGLYGVDLKEVQVDKIGKTRSGVVTCAEAYLYPSSPGPKYPGGPVRVSYAQGFTYVIARLNQKAKGESCEFKTTDVNGVVFGALANIAHADRDAVKDMKGTHVSWFRVICRVLQEKGYIQGVEFGQEGYTVKL